MNKDDTSVLPLILNEDDSGIFNLIDKYIKANNNFLPLQSYVDFLETNSLNVFSTLSISTAATTKPATVYANSSSLITVNKLDDAKTDGILIAQRLYKIVISIDYSPQATNLDFIQKSLNKIFEKINSEYDQFTESVQTEPHIYVTVLLWNSVYFQYKHHNNQIFNNYFFNDEFVPFTIICHAKRLLKINLLEMASFLYEKVNEAKNSFLAAFKSSQQRMKTEMAMNDVSNKLIKAAEQQATKIQNNKDVGSLERLLMHVLKIFSFFNVNNSATSVGAPTALSLAHHIYISDGLFYANDMIRCLEKISKSSISFSFIYSGSGLNHKQYHSANNISSSFGYVADHYLMKFIAQMTNGFYAAIDDNLEYHFICTKRLLFFTNLNNFKQSKEDTNMSNDLSTNADTIIDNEDENAISLKTLRMLPQSNSFCCSSNANNENNVINNIIYMSQQYQYQHAAEKISSGGTHRFSNHKANSKQILRENQQMEIKCIQKYELSTSIHSVYQLTRFRTQEGFFLIHISKSYLNNDNKTYLITFHFKRFFTQTTILFYKLSYPCKTQSADEKSEANASSKDDKLIVEIWLSWSFLHLKAKYQNLILIQQLRHTLSHIQKVDFDRSFNLSQVMLNPPDILRLKEPLFKQVSSQLNNATFPSNEVNDLKTLKISMQNSTFEINIRNKGMENEFVDFANAWLSLAFFKYNTSTLAKHFSIHTIKLVLDHDRLAPADIYTNIYTFKNALLLPEHQHVGNLNPTDQIYDNEYFYVNNYYYDTTGNSNYRNNNFAYNQHNPISSNSNQIIDNNTANNKGNIFQCRNALNKLCVMLIGWCDLVLVENCVFLKYCSKQQLQQNTTNENEEKEQDIENETSDKEVNKSSMEHESFVLIKIDTTFVPYVSLQYLFHSSISYSERMRLIQKLKEQLKVLNLNNLESDSVSSIQSSIFTGIATPPAPPLLTPSITSPQQLAINKSIQIGLSSPSSYKFNTKNLLFTQTEATALSSATVSINSNSNLSNKMKRKQECCCILLQKPDLFDTILSHFNKAYNQQQNLNTIENKKSGQQQQWQHNPSQVLNFMAQKKFKWTLNKSFSTQVSLTLKENIIDAFIRTRLREGFKCLYQCSKFAVFTIQLNMFDQGTTSLNDKATNDTSRKSTLSENDSTSSLPNQNVNFSKSNISFKNGSSQYCTFVYVIYFMNYASESVYFTTEIYSEVIDGICLDKKINTSNENRKNTCDYFRNLNHAEILNLIFLIDLKSVSVLQSTSALFLDKSDSIKNLYSLLSASDSGKNFDSESQFGSALWSSQKSSYFLTQETTTKILNYNVNFHESIRILPDLNLIAKSLQSMNTNQSNVGRLNSVNELASSTGSTGLHNRIRKPACASDSEMSLTPKVVYPMNKFSQLNPIETITTTTFINSLTTTTSETKEVITTPVKKKKSDSILLHDQIKPVLNSIFHLPVSQNVSRDIMNINFQFSLRSILFESTLFVSVFEDVPFNLFNSATCASKKLSIQETNSIHKIQTLFFSKINDNLKKNDMNSTNDFMSAPLPRSQAANRGSITSLEDLENRNQYLMIEHVKKELKNTICLRLNDIKSGDSVNKQIIDNLNAVSQSSTIPTSSSTNNEIDSEAKNFQFYFKFNVAQSTSVQSEPSNFGMNRNGIEQEQPINDSDNRFFVYGLFFLNNTVSGESSQASNRLVFFMFDCLFDNIKKSMINSSSNTYLIRKSLFSAQKINNSSKNQNMSQTSTSESNKIAFSDTYRFYYSKGASDQLRSTNNSSSTTTNNINTISTSNRKISNGEALNSRIYMNNNSAPVSTTPNTFRKKFFSISDILKFHLNNYTNYVSSNDSTFLYYLDMVEENCAKSYIESVVHYLGIHSSSNPSVPRSTSLTEDKRIKFETDSIKKLLKIGRKLKLIDVDLTDYLKIICAHLSNHNNSETCDWSMTCNNSKNDSSGRQSYLEKKFNDLFLKKFNLLPGFNDLFIFTPNQYCKNMATSQDDQLSSIDHSFDNGNAPANHRMSRKRLMHRSKHKKAHKQAQSYSQVDSDNRALSASLLGTLRNTARSSDSIKLLIEKELNESMNKSLDDLFRNNWNSDDDLNCDFMSDYDYDDDDNDQDDYEKICNSFSEDETSDNSFMDNSKIEKKILTVHSTTTTTEDDEVNSDTEDDKHVRKNSLRTKRKNKFKSSSPFSNSSVILNKNFDLIKSKENPLIIPVVEGVTKQQTSATQTQYDKVHSVGEQMISIELILIVGSDSDDTLLPSNTGIGLNSNNNNNNNGSTNDLDDANGSRQSRVRTTTLTPDYSNTNPADTLLNTVGLDNSGISNQTDQRLISDTLPQENIKNESGNQNQQNQLIGNQFKTSNSRRTIFFSKFNRLNLQCLLDLIEEKDQNEFRQLIKQLETEATGFSIETNQQNETITTPSSGSFVLGNNIKVYLRFNWYSFSDLNLNYTSTSLLHSQQKSTNPKIGLLGVSSKLQHQQQQQQSGSSLLQKSMFSTKTGLASLHSSSSTVYNSMTNVASSASILNVHTNLNSKYFANRNFKDHHQQFEYSHLLNPILKEFKWHLKDEIFQLEQTKIKNLLVFISHMSHIGEGVRRKYPHCRLIRRKIILNKKTTTTISTPVDPKPKTNASKLLSVNLREQQQQIQATNNKPAYKTTKHVEEDKSILSVDPPKFFEELILLLKNLDSFYDCKLQQMNDYFYYLNCNLNAKNKTSNMKLDENFKSYSFKILIRLHNSSNSFIKKNPNAANQNKNSLSSVSTITNNNVNKITTDNRPITNTQQQEIQQEITINQIKIKIFFSFNHTYFQNRDDLIETIILQFNQLLNKLIKTVYLSLSLREIHDTRKWNNLLQLIDNTGEENSKNLKDNKSFSSIATAVNTDSNDSVLTIKKSVAQGSLACNCVWSVKFKLHRLHQTVQKIHGSTEITPSTPSILQQQQMASASSIQQQQYISQGLKKLQESLVNFKIEESSKCGDLYVYTRKDEIFLLKLEEIYEAQQLQNSMNITNNNTLANMESTGGDNSVSIPCNDNSIDLSSSYARQQSKQATSLISRRPSYASIADSDMAATFKSNPNYSTTAPGNKSQNLSGGSINNATVNSGQLPNQTNILNTTPINPQQQLQQQQTRLNTEYIKLSVYGLSEPDEQMKLDLCKTLQSELDHYLLTKMCDSIAKNTFKTTSAQHPDKITDEDLTFFKSISENYFDFEIPLPFIFNFNKNLRENFFFFIKQIFNTNFKAIDAPSQTTTSNSNLSSSLYLSSSHSNSSSGNSNQLRKSFSMRTKSHSSAGHQQSTAEANIKSNEPENESEYDELANLIYNDECSQENPAQPTLASSCSSSSAVKTSIQTMSSMFHSQQLSFSFMSLQPQLGPYISQNKASVTPSISLDSNTFASKQPQFNMSSKRLNDQDPLMILLSRILFYNSKNIRIGKHAVSLVLVEALYAVKSLDVLVLSRVTRSNSIGANSAGAPKNIEPTNNQILETSYTQSKLTGPTFVFRFYCRGENDTNSYKSSLKSALNDALLYFFSEYVTKIEPERYLKKIGLAKVPAQFRKCRFQVDSTTPTTINHQSECKRTKKRHKSTGNCGDENPIIGKDSEELSLNMNKTALETNLGKIILKHKIDTESQFNAFTVNNFNSNLFDHRNYEDTIEYFRESIRAFDYNRILNSFISDASLNNTSSTSLLMSTSSSSASSIENENSNTNTTASHIESENESDSDASLSESSYSSEISDSMSLDDMAQTTIVSGDQTSITALNETPSTPTLNNQNNDKVKTTKQLNTNIAFRKSYLRFIYEWLKGLYYVQIRAGMNLCSRSVGSIQLKPTQQHQQQQQQQRTNTTPNQQLSSSLILSPIQQQQQQQQQQFSSNSSSSPSNQSGSLANIISASAGQHQPFTPFILRKKFCYKTKYNLTSLLRDIETGLRDSCKSNEIVVNYFSFSGQEPVKKKHTNKSKPSCENTTLEVAAIHLSENSPLETASNTNSSTKELKSCLRSQTDTAQSTQTKQQRDYYAACFGANSLLDDNEFGNDFKNLKQTKFSNIHDNLSRSENLIITMNVEYCSPVIIPATSAANVFTQSSTINANNVPTGSSLSSSSSNNSSSNVLTDRSTVSNSATIVPSYSRVPSFSGTINSNTKQNILLQQQLLFDQQSASANLMTKSMNSNSGADLLDMSLSVSNALSLAALQLKRTYLYALCNSRTRTITFYVFTTETTCHDQLKQLLDNSCDVCLQRYHLVNNTVLYKYGGLVGDMIISDLKKVKQLTTTAIAMSACNANNNSNSFGLSTLDSAGLAFNTPTPSTTLPTANEQAEYIIKSSATANTKVVQHSPKLLYRQLSYKMPIEPNKTGSQPINSSLISNLTQQFGASTSQTSSSNNQPALLSFKQLIMASTNLKAFDLIVNIVNQQVNFCQQYLSISSPFSSIGDTFASGIIGSTQNPLGYSPSYSLLTPNSSFNNYSFNRQTSLIATHTMQQQQIQSRLMPVNPYGYYSSTSTLYGVGFNYQLCELQQVYRHPRKIYELALTLVNNNPQQPTQVQPLSSKSNQQLTVNEFYKNYIVPVLIPFHYCCSPILFYSNWNDMIVNEQSLRFHQNVRASSKTSDASNKNQTANQQSVNPVQSYTTNVMPKGNKPSGQQQGAILLNTDVWYQKMRQILLTEYTKYFESRGFLRLRDENKESSNTNKTNSNNQTQNEILVYHFIKWIQQDGFIYLTLNLEEIFANIKLGYCTRYRMASRSFLNEMIKFFSTDFHIHSLSYDYHLTAINRNLMPSSWSSPKHMSLTISKFLDEFVDFFSRVPWFSSNKVFKVVYEKTDYSVTSHKFGLIFDFLMFAKKKLNKNGQFNTSVFTPLDVNLDNNIGIYTISDQKPDTYSKYLVIKIERFTTTVTTPAQTTNAHSSSSLNKKTVITKTESLQPNIFQAKTVNATQSKLSSSSSSSSLINQKTMTAENSFSNLNQLQQSQLFKQSTVQQVQQQTSTKQMPNKSIQTRQESHIRVVCYYLCINKQTSQLSTAMISQNEPNSEILNVNQFDQDLLFIDKMVEESINVYKLETFWDNLVISMSSITDYLNETITSSIPAGNTPLGFSILESEELEQILNHSQKIDALELDPNLYSFLRNCFTIKDKIKQCFEMSFGRHFIFTSSDSCDYCLLLINDNLIKKFRYTVSSSSGSQLQALPTPVSSVTSDKTLHVSLSANSNSSSSPSGSAKTKTSSSSSHSKTDKKLNSFILLKFDKINKMSHLSQINRIVQPSNLTNEMDTSNSLCDSSLITNTNMSNSNTATSAKLRKVGSNKYLSFAINNLMLVLWEGLFYNN